MSFIKVENFDEDVTRRPNQKSVLSTVIVETATSCFRITQVFFDTCSTKTFVHPRFVRRAGLNTCAIKPVRFIGDYGREIICNGTVQFLLWISGIRVFVEAYVGNTNHERLLRLGLNAMRDLRCRVNTAYGPDAETRILVAQDVRGYRRLQFVVEPDAPDQRTEITTMTRRQGIQWSKDHAKTPLQYKASRQLLRYSSSYYGSTYPRSYH